jgi:hypothetical protein
MKHVTNRGNPALIEAIGEHIERHIGPILQVWDEEDSDRLHIDVFHVDAAADRPFQALITCGMSEFPMRTSTGAEAFGYAELAILLPRDWPVTPESLADPSLGWPFWLLKQLARYPHANETWLGPGHTVSNPANPGVPFAPDTRQDSVILLPPSSTSSEFWSIRSMTGRRTYFWGVDPLYPEERDLARRKGSGALLERFDAIGVTDVVSPRRPVAIPPR